MFKLQIQYHQTRNCTSATSQVKTHSLVDDSGIACGTRPRRQSNGCVLHACVRHRMHAPLPSPCVWREARLRALLWLCPVHGAQSRLCQHCQCMLGKHTAQASAPPVRDPPPHVRLGLRRHEGYSTKSTSKSSMPYSLVGMKDLSPSSLSSPSRPSLPDTMPTDPSSPSLPLLPACLPSVPPRCPRSLRICKVSTAPLVCSMLLPEFQIAPVATKLAQRTQAITRGNVFTLPVMQQPIKQHCRTGCAAGHCRACMLPYGRISYRTCKC